MTKAERIADLAGQIEDEARAKLIKEIIETLKEFAVDGVAADEKPGMRAAIQIIKANFQ